MLFLTVSLVIGILSEISLKSQERAVAAEQQKDDFLGDYGSRAAQPAGDYPLHQSCGRALQSTDNGRSEIIDRQVQQLDQMIEDLMDISQVSRGKFRLKFEAVDVPTLVEDAVEKSRPFIAAANMNWRSEPPAGEMTLWGDPARLQQVITNLSRTRPATRQRRQDRVPDIAGKGYAVFRVRDNGLGIPKELVSRVFDLQTQVARSLETSGPSLGVGLALFARSWNCTAAPSPPSAKGQARERIHGSTAALQTATEAGRDCVDFASSEIGRRPVGNE